MDNNPWTVEDLDSYLFYCCPECDQKYKSKPSFINHAYSSHPHFTVCHPDAKENLKFEETTEDIVIKSDLNIIKEETDIIENSEFDIKEPENDIENEEGELDDYNNESLDWYEPEVYEESFDEDPPKKKRGRPPKHKIEDDDWSENNSVPKKKKSKRSSAESAINSPQKMQKEEPVLEEEIDGPVQCYRCGEVFDTITLVKQHLTAKHRICRKIHYGKERPFQCLVCKFMFESEEKMSDHFCRPSMAEEKWGRNHCDICDIGFPNRDKLMCHNTVYHLTEKNFACDKCDFKTKLPKALGVHKKRIHEGVKDEVCHICGTAVFNKYMLQAHMKRVHAEKKDVICDKCGSTFNNLTSLKGHIKEKHRQYLLCSYCDKRMFGNSRQLRIHLINEHDVKCGAKDFYVCWKCKKCCSSFKDLDEHLSNEHEMNKNEHRCQLCQDEMFSSRVTLKMHVLKFHDIDFSKVSNTPFIHELFDIITEPNCRTIPGAGVPCPVCQKKFSSNRSLSDHRRQVHEKANHIKCDHCKFTTFQPYMLKKHIQRQHTKTTLYQCEQCSYNTYDYHAIGCHKKIHNKTKAIQCSECNKAYNHKRSYAEHLLKVHNIVYQWAQ